MNRFPLDVELKRFDPSTPADSDLVLDGFLAYVKAKGLSLYEAQEEAILALYEGRNLILNTPTGSGKSLVALALHFHSIANQRRSYYTCPIKALVNEKFLALCHDFGPARVGMITGEASVNPDAPIICCTAEILSNLALREGKAAKVDDVIMDEFHYYSDRERGVAWQIPLLSLPQARFMLMSATLGDVQRFETGLSELNQRPTTVIKSVQRPVPLSYFYQETPLHETVQNLVQNGKAPVYMVAFTQRECAEEAQNLLSVDICSKEEKQAIAAALSELNLKFSSPFGKEIQKLVKHGVGLHHAGLLPKYRYMVERLAQKGLLKVICGTDTLGVGVNIPIRSVLFTKLCKFDGSKTALLTVRDFKQIAGRAGRKGFDDHGFVVAQAPEHVIENLRAEAKAGNDPKKLKRVQKKKPPERGFVMWTRESFDKLIASEPEALASRFTVSHGMLLNVLSRPGDGCAEMKNLIQSSHETPQSKRRLRKLAFQMFRSLIDRKIVEFGELGSTNGRRSIKLNVDLQEDFSIHHALALFLIDTVKLVDPYSETYALDILSLAEAIIEDPDMILRKQLDRIKTRRMYEMKMEGMEYEDRIAELEKLEYPKPNREFVYQHFNEFAAKHPWVGQENIRPKSIAREMYEEFMNFAEYIREYELQRSEGLLLRYLAEVYKVLVQTLPDTAKDDEMNSIIEYIGAMVRQVDSTLLDEWERLSRPDAAKVASETDTEVKRDDYDITRNRRDFTVAIRNECFQYIKALSNRRLDAIIQYQREELGHPESHRLGYKLPYFDPAGLKQLMDSYSVEHEGPLCDRSARNTALISIEESGAEVWKIRQILVDAAGHNDWYLEFDLIIAASRALNRPVLVLTKLGNS